MSPETPKAQPDSVEKKDAAPDSPDQLKQDLAREVATLLAINPEKAKNAISVDQDKDRITISINGAVLLREGANPYRVMVLHNSDVGFSSPSGQSGVHERYCKDSNEVRSVIRAIAQYEIRAKQQEREETEKKEKEERVRVVENKFLELNRADAPEVKYPLSDEQISNLNIGYSPSQIDNIAKTNGVLEIIGKRSDREILRNKEDALGQLNKDVFALKNARAIGRGDASEKIGVSNTLIYLRQLALAEEARGGSPEKFKAQRVKAAREAYGKNGKQGKEGGLQFTYDVVNDRVQILPSDPKGFPVGYVKFEANVPKILEWEDLSRR